MFSTLFFFFSSRRRHTRSLRDWSSDVCSSDLPYEPEPGFTYVNRCCTEENAEQYSKRGRLWSRRHQRDHWTRSAFINVGSPDVEWRGRNLESDADKHQRHRNVRKTIAHGRGRCSDCYLPRPERA